MRISNLFMLVNALYKSGIKMIEYKNYQKEIGENAGYERGFVEYFGFKGNKVAVICAYHKKDQYRRQVYQRVKRPANAAKHIKAYNYYKYGTLYGDDIDILEYKINV